MSFNRNTAILAAVVVALGLPLYAACAPSPPVVLEQVFELPLVGQARMAGIEVALLHDGVIYYSDSHLHGIVSRRDRSTLRAVELQTGQEIWALTGISETYRLEWGNDALWVVDRQGGVLMVSPASGQVVSEFTFPERLNELMSVDDRLFGLSSGSVRAVSLDTGTTLWSSSFPTGFRPLSTSDLYENIFRIAWDYSSIVYEGQHVLVNLVATEIRPSENVQAMVLALNTTDGTESWRFSYDLPTTPQGRLATWPFVIDSDRGRVFLAAGTLSALDSNSGEVAWRTEDHFDYIPWQAAVVGDGLLVIREDYMTVVGIDLEQGAVVWTHEVPSHVTLLQLLGDEVVLMSESDGTSFEGIELASGQSSWIWNPPRKHLRHWVIDFEFRERRLYIATQTKIYVYRFNDR
jgi:outer membrane protein assembly factor BamB